MEMAYIKLQSACVLALSLGMTALAQASAPLATEYGCVNCHGVNPRGEAPSFELLAAKMTKYQGDEAGLSEKVVKYRTGEPLEHIDAHERISAATATVLLRWLAEGGK